MFNLAKTTYSKARQDLESILVKVILNQTDEFSLEGIVYQAKSQLSDSTSYSCEELNSVCSDIIQTLYHFDLLQLACKGKYILSIACPTVSSR